MQKDPSDFKTTHAASHPYAIAIAIAIAIGIGIGIGIPFRGPLGSK